MRSLPSDIQSNRSLPFDAELVATSAAVSSNMERRLSLTASIARMPPLELSKDKASDPDSKAVGGSIPRLYWRVKAPTNSTTNGCGG